MTPATWISTTGSGTSLLSFLDHVLVDADGELVLAGSVLDPWQREDFTALESSGLRCLGRGGDDAPMRHYLERPRGHSKTTDVALFVLWLLVVAPRALRGFAYARDRDQARILRDAVGAIVRANPVLRELVEVNRYEVKVVDPRHPGYESTLSIESADVAGSFGILPDFVVADEVSHWPGTRELWDSLLSSAAKRASCVFVAISNAGMGMGTSWQWDVREQCRTSDGWHFSRLDGPRASWIDEATLDEQRAFLPSKTFGRLWLNVWQTETGDALDAVDIEAAIRWDQPIWMPGGLTIAGLDLGLRNDHSALVVVQVVPESGRFRVVHSESWKPADHGGQVSLVAVEAECRAAVRRYDLAGIVYDPYQAERMAESLSHVVPMYPFHATAANLDAMALSLLDVFRNRLIDLYRDEDLVRDLLRLEIVERQQGFRLKATRDEHGHCDRGTALAMVLPFARATLADLQDDQPSDSIEIIELAPTCSHW